MIVSAQSIVQPLSLCAIFQHSALLDLDNDTAFFGVFDGHGGKLIAKNCELSMLTIFSTSHTKTVCLSPSYFLHVSGKVVAKFCAKYLHREVVNKETYASGDLGTAVQRAFFRYGGLLVC
jgi:protein phosphatase 1G